MNDKLDQIGPGRDQLSLEKPEGVASRFQPKRFYYFLRSIWALTTAEAVVEPRFEI